MKALKVAVALTLSGALLASCSSAEPQREVSADFTRPVAIGIVDGSPEQSVLGEVYARVLASVHREATVITLEDPRMSALQQRDVDFVVGCTGELLEKLNLPAARELAAANQKAEEVTGVGVEEYETLMRALPTGLRSTDVSTAMGCEEASDDLAQNIVPVFRTSMFDRHELKELREASVLLTTEELHEMLEEVEDGATPQEAAAKWYGSQIFTEQVE